MNIKSIIHQYNFNFLYAKALVDDVPEKQMTVIPAKSLVNHPAFTLGHLISGSALVAKNIGGENKMPEEWSALFLRKGPGDSREPEVDTGQYPKKRELLAELEKQHLYVIQLMDQLTDEDLNKTLSWRFANYFPRLFDYINFMCVNHEAMHLGQLAAWRREMGLPSALATL